MRTRVHRCRLCRQLVHQAPDAAWQRLVNMLVAWNPLAGEPEEMTALALGQPERADQRGQSLRRGRDRPSLLQLDEVVKGHTGELDDLLAAKPARTPVPRCAVAASDL
jgi:hypothetical protein